MVGCHIVGDGAAEMVQMLGIAIKMKATKADFDATRDRGGANDSLAEISEPIELVKRSFLN